MQEPVRIYRASNIGQCAKLVIVFFVLLPFVLLGVGMLIVSSRTFFESCFAWTVTFASFSCMFGLMRVVYLRLPLELKVYADRLEVIDPWSIPRTSHTYVFADIKGVRRDSEGWVVLKLFSSIWPRTLSEDLFRDKAEAEEFCRYLTELLKTPSPAINNPVA